MKNKNPRSYHSCVNHSLTCSFAGSLLSVPLHPRHHGQGEGRETEAVLAARSSGQGAQVTRTRQEDKRRVMKNHDRSVSSIMPWNI